MESVNFVILGDQSIATDFGKKGTSTDLTLFDRKEAEKIYTFVTPNGFPEKIQPLFQAIALAEYVIFHVNVLDKFTGEQILALDALGKKEGILSHSYDVDESRLNLMIKGTVIEGYKKVEQDKIKEELANFATIKKNGDTSIVIDHTFDVKGVGTVALGKVLSGKITQYDKILHYPSETEAMIKSIQMHDDDVKESVSPARVGLSLKNIKHDEIARGDIFSNDSAIKITTEITIDFVQNQFFKGTISENQMCLVNIGLQIKAAKFASVSPLKLQFEKPVAVMPGDVCVLLKPESNSVRIMGSGTPQ
jgi:selenocysteine-specific translation elongation factor